MADGKIGKNKINGKRQAAFTLLELLVVIAITTILLGLLFGPIIQSFNITRRSQAVAAAQDAARFGLERITRELSQASYVYDNTRTPIILPFSPNHLPPDTNGNLANPRPSVLFAKLDFVPAVTIDSKVEDPTTGGPLGGARLRFPSGPGRRVVRYAIALRNNLPDAAGNPATYQNVYEFPRTDGGAYNPFILWRFEFDPRDPNLIDQSVGPSNPDYFTPNSGSFDDPNFFYNVAKRGLNGNTFAENWRAGTPGVPNEGILPSTASPVLSVDKVDLIAWNRTIDREISPTQPFRTTVSFSPSTVVGDAATPGHLTDTGNEVPNAVPSVYTAKHGLWTLPYTITVYRFASRNSTDDPRYGFLRVQVRRDPDGIVRPHLEGANGNMAAGSFGSLKTTQTNNANTSEFAHSFSARGNLFLKTTSLTFQVDPLRGRIITAFPPLAATNGVPEFNQTPNSPTFGEPIATVLRRNTLSPLAGRQVPGAPINPPTFFPLNAGLRDVELAPERSADPDTANRRDYYPAGPAPQTLDPNNIGPYASPFTLFGDALIIPGSERVLGPDTNPNNPNLMPYQRAPVLSSLNRQSGGIEAISPTVTIFTGFPSGPLNYRLELDLAPLTPRVVFDDAISPTPPPQGLPAVLVGNNIDQRTDPFDDRSKLVEITYLWQNNYARAVSGPNTGVPVDARGRNVAGRAVAPEADVVKVDYSTRSLLNITLGVRVYDVASGRPQQVQLTDKVKVNNAGR